jgi:hypothetical protein
MEVCDGSPDDARAGVQPDSSGVETIASSSIRMVIRVMMTFSFSVGGRHPDHDR